MKQLFRHTAFTLTLICPMASQAETINDTTVLAAQSIEGTPVREQKVADSFEEKRTASSGNAWFERTEIAGLIEFEAGYYKPASGKSESDITLATFELGIVSQVNNHLEAGATLLYEEDATPLEVDTAYATLGNTNASPYFITAGQIYVPFGIYATNMLSDPLTLEIGETRESALKLGIKSGAFSAGAYMFNGDIKKGSNNSVDSWGAYLGFLAEGETLSLSMDAGYINNLGDSDSLQALIIATSGSNSVAKRTGAYTLNTILTIGPLNMIGEYLVAADNFASTEFNWNGVGARPSAWNFEAGYTFSIGSQESTFALGYQESNEALALGLPKNRAVVTLSTSIDDNTSLGIEWTHDHDYAANESAIDVDGVTVTGSDTVSNTATLQLAITF